MFTWSNTAGRLLGRALTRSGNDSAAPWAQTPRTPAAPPDLHATRRDLIRALGAESSELLDLAALDTDFDAVVADLHRGKILTYGDVTATLLARARARVTTTTPPATHSPWVWAHITPGRSRRTGVVHAGALTPDAARHLVSEARAHGDGAALEITIMAPSREARTDEVRRQLEPLCGTQVRLRVRASDEPAELPRQRTRRARPAPPQPRMRQRLTGAFAGGLR